MTRREQHIDALTRRHNYLAEMVGEEAAGGFMHARRELAALRYTLALLNVAPPYVLDDLELRANAAGHIGTNDLSETARQWRAARTG